MTLSDRASVSLAVVGLACGCGSSSDMTSDATFIVETIGDTTILRSTEPLWPDSARLVLQSTIGVVDGAEEYMLSSISALAVDRAGAVFVADRATNEIRKFDPDGEHHVTFGGEGSGPGELRAPEGLGVLGDGGIVVRDSRLLRINVYDSAGSSIDHWPFAGHGTFGAGADITIDSSGGVYTQIMTSTGDPMAPPNVAMARWTSGGDPTDTLPLPDHYAVACPPERLDANGMSLPVPETPHPVSAFSATGYLIGCSGTYRFDHVQLDGTVRRLERAWTPVPISDAERDFWTEGVTAQARARTPGWRWSGAPVPDRKPAYRSFFGGEAGRIWVRTPRRSIPRPRPERMPEYYPDLFYSEPVGFDVFASDGRYLGPVNVPSGFRDRPAPVFRGDTVWAVILDDNGVQQVGRFHVVRDGTERGLDPLTADAAIRHLATGELLRATPPRLPPSVETRTF